MNDDSERSMILRIALLFACLLGAFSAYAQDGDGQVMLPVPGNTAPPAGGPFPTLDNPPQKPAAPSSSGVPASLREDGDPGPVSKYIKSTWANLVKSMIHYDALNIDDLNLVDEYAQIAECDIYKHFHENEFMWHKIRKEIQDEVHQQKASFPIFLHFDTKLQFGHYDFDKKIYFFTEKTKIKNINAFTLLSAIGPPCVPGEVIKNLPKNFHAVISDPVGLEGIPYTSTDAETIHDAMEADKNIDHIVYTRFNLHITYILPLEKRLMLGTSGKVEYVQGGFSAGNARLDATLDSIDFFEDPAMTKSIYTYYPGKDQSDKTAIPLKVATPPGGKQ